MEINQPLIHPHRFWVGLCGDTSSFSDIIGWLSSPEDYKRVPTGKGGDFLVLNEKGHIYTFGSPREWLPVNQEYYAVGSGMNYAMAAMASGKSPIEAVKIAAKFDPHTGMGFEKKIITKV